MPANALADVEGIGEAVRGNFPAFRQLPCRDLYRDVLVREVIFVPIYCPIGDKA